MFSIQIASTYSATRCGLLLHVVCLSVRPSADCSFGDMLAGRSFLPSTVFVLDPDRVNLAPQAAG